MNLNEAIVKQKLEERGFTVFRNGWPDFLCTRSTVRQALGSDWSGEKPVFETIRGACAVEVKTRTDRLSAAQKVVRTVLQAAHIPVYVVRPDEIDAAINGSKRRLFLTNEEIRHLRDLAEQARQRAIELQKEVSKLNDQIHQIQGMVDGAGDVLSEAAFAIDHIASDEGLLTSPIGEYKLPARSHPT